MIIFFFFGQFSFFFHFRFYINLVLSVDAMDASGQTQLDLEHNLFKKRLDRNGNPVAATPLKEDCNFVFFFCQILF